MIRSTFALAVVSLPLLVSSARADEAEAPTRWPRAVIARPLTVPQGVAQLGADVIGNHDLSAISARLVAGYGLSEKLEVTGYYLYALEEFEAKGDLDLNVGYAALRGAAGGKLEVVPRLQAGYSFLAEAMRPLALGAQVQYNVTDQLAIITPGGQLSVALEEDAAMATPVTLSLPVAVGFQATPALYAQVDTSLATLDISDSANAFLFADSTPLALTLIYNAIPALDVSAGIGVNLTPAEPLGVGDTLGFLVGARYYAGAL